MTDATDRRSAIQQLGLGLGLSAVAASASASPLRRIDGSGRLAELTRRLAKAPRRRDYRTAPMILTHPEQWDFEALNAVMAYKGPHKQVWDHTDLTGPWLNGMRNVLNTQVFSFGHADFLLVSATHGPAQMALLDDYVWRKYDLPRLAGKGFETNVLLQERPAAKADPFDLENAQGLYSAANTSIPALQARGVVFLACHNALWELAARLIQADVNPDHVPVDALAADLTNHLAPGVILTPGAVATAIELQRAGFAYAR